MTVRRWPGPLRRSADTICVTWAPTIVALTTSRAVCTPPVMASEALTRPARAAVPRNRSWRSEESDNSHRTDHLELIDVNVDVMEASEEHEAVRPRRVQLACKVGESGQERRQLDGNGDAELAFHLAHDVNRVAFDLGGAGRGVTGRMVNVQLQRVGSGLFQKPCIGKPAARRASH